MKLKYYFLSLVLATSCGFALTSCDDDDDPVVVEAPELTFDTDGALRVKIGEENKTLVPVVTGGGQYNAYSLDEEIAKAVIEDGQLYVEGFKNGSTRIVVSDANSKYKMLTVNVYTTEELTLNHTECNIVSVLGFSATNNECAVELGNGSYKISSDNPLVSASIDEETGEITLTATSKKDEYTATVTVTDISNLSAEINVTVQCSLDPFTQSELDELMAAEESLIDYNGSHSSYFEYYKKVPMESTTENGYTYTGWNKTSYYGYDHVHRLRYPEGTAVGVETDGQLLMQSGYSPTTHDGKIKILADDATHFVGIYYKVDLDKEKIDRGYVVWVK